MDFDTDLHVTVQEYSDYEKNTPKVLAEQLATYLLQVQKAEQFVRLSKAEAHKAAKALYKKNPKLWDEFKTVHVLGGRSVLRFSCDISYDAHGVEIEEVTDL